MANTSHRYIPLTTFLVMYFTSSARAHFIDTLKFTTDSLVICPDGFKCNDNSTCCLNGQGFGCCPYKNAVCCSDKVHCCPSGMRCDMTQQQCVTLSAYRALSAIPTNVRREAAADPNDVVPEAEPKLAEAISLVCPDRSACAAPHSACCRRPSGLFSCCNYPNNVCCDGGTRCCPAGTVCDSIHSLCYTSPTNVDTPSYGWAEGVIQPKFTPTRSTAAIAAADKDDI